jgi:hypothetical protein
VTTFERGLIHGLAIAAAFMVRGHDEPTCAAEIITEQGYGWSDLKRANIDEYDLEALRPILCKRKSPATRAGEKREAPRL